MYADSGGRCGLKYAMPLTTHPLGPRLLIINFSVLSCVSELPSIDSDSNQFKL
jgi:hypothetical protein